MTREQVETEIRRLIATETDAMRFSNAIFTPGGLVSKLFSTPEEKKAVIDSSLFDEANRRLSELQRQEASRLKKSEPTVLLPTAAGLNAEQLKPSQAAS